jgi:hypothetical protein
MPGHRNARVDSLIEHAPITTCPEVHLSGGGNLFTLTVIRPAWAYRVELAGITLLAYLYWWLTGEVGDRRQASLIILAATAALMLVPPVCNGLATILHRSHLRRSWTLACRHADLATLNDRLPRISRASFVPSGDLLPGPHARRPPGRGPGARGRDDRRLPGGPRGPGGWRPGQRPLRPRGRGPPRSPGRAGGHALAALGRPRAVAMGAGPGRAG